MLKILKYSFYDLMRSRWSYVYFLFYLILGFVLLFLNNDVNKAVITLMNIIIVLTPLIGTIFGVMYYYNSREFTELLLAQPINRKKIFMGQYLGISISLTLSLVLGLGIPFVLYGLFKSAAIFNFGLLLVVGSFLNYVIYDGNFILGSGNHEGFILKLAPNGNLIWRQAIGGTNPDNASAVDLDQFNNIIIEINGGEGELEDQERKIIKKIL